MLRLFLRAMLVAGIGMTGAACQDDGYGAPSGYYQPAATGYGNPYYNNPPPAPRYGYGQPAPSYNYGNQPGSHGWYNQTDGRRYTTVTVTNRGQNGYRDDVVQQQVVCGSQYYDGYRTAEHRRAEDRHAAGGSSSVGARHSCGAFLVDASYERHVRAEVTLPAVVRSQRMTCSLAKAELS